MKDREENQQGKEIKEVSIFDVIGPLPRSYFTVSEPKLQVSSGIKDGLEKTGLSLREAAKKLDSLYKEDSITTPHYNTIQQITSGGNFKFNNLLLLLDILGKKILIVDQTEEDKLYIESKGKTDLRHL